MIPQIAHFIWLNEDPPDWVTRNVNTFEEFHPDWTIWIWRHPPENMPVDLRQLMSELPYVVSRSDIFRYWLLAEYGGVYLDCDNVAIRNFAPLLDTEFFTAPCMCVPHTVPHVACGLMGSSPGSFHALEILAAIRTKMIDPNERDRKSYGPDLMTPIFSEEAIRKKQLENPIWPRPTIYPIHYFYLIPDRPTAREFWLGDQRVRDRIMDRFRPQWTDDVPPYSVHLWGVNDSSTRTTGCFNYVANHYPISQCRTVVGPVHPVSPESEVL
jgi:hypothetical protein